VQLSSTGHLLREGVRYETTADFNRFRVAAQSRTNQGGLGIPALILSPMSDAPSGGHV
jgi:hypothetical protein